MRPNQTMAQGTSASCKMEFGEMGCTNKRLLYLVSHSGLGIQLLPRDKHSYAIDYELECFDL